MTTSETPIYWDASLRNCTVEKHCESFEEFCDYLSTIMPREISIETSSKIYDDVNICEEHQKLHDGKVVGIDFHVYDDGYWEFTVSYEFPNGEVKKMKITC